MKIYLSVLTIIVSFLFMSPTLSRSQSSEQISVVKAVAPVYPDMLAYENISGTIVVEAKVNSRGEVIASRSLGGDISLSELAEIGARKWIFASRDQPPIDRTVLLTFVFRIMPKETSADDLTPIFMPPYQIEVREVKPELVQTPNIDPPGRDYPSKNRRKKP